MSEYAVNFYVGNYRFQFLPHMPVVPGVVSVSYLVATLWFCCLESELLVLELIDEDHEHAGHNTFLSLLFLLKTCIDLVPSVISNGYSHRKISLQFASK